MSTTPGGRRDLAAMAVPLARALVAAEEPMRTQAALAQAIGADKSRIISDLDELQERGLIQRQPDAADRRVHLLSLTPAGSQVRQFVQSAIRRREEQILGRLPPG